MRQLAMIHGGLTAAGRRKTARPMAPRRAMHVVFRSSRARGAWSLSRSRRRIRELIALTARQSSVRVLHMEVLGQHLHLVVRAGSRQRLQHFLRVFPQRVMFAVTGARKGNPRGRFWDALALTHLLDQARDASAEKPRSPWRRILLGLPDLFSGPPAGPDSTGSPPTSQ